MYFDQPLNEMQYQLPQIFPYGLEVQNKVISFKGPAAEDFSVLASDKIMDFKCGFNGNGGTQCLPLYRYTADGERVCNITDWGIRQFNDHYREEWGNAFEELAGPEGITAEDIFAYTYAVLHDPVYRHDYRVDLLREFPRLPFYHEFDVWKQMGQELLDLEGEPRRVILRADKAAGTIVTDDKTTLRGVHPEAWGVPTGQPLGP